MYPVSQQFRAAIASDARKVYGRVTVDYTDPFIDQSMQVTANQQQNDVGFLQQTADTVNAPPRRWASADGSTLANGLSFPAPSLPADGQMGWWGIQMSGAGGAFISPFPTLTVSFASRPIHRLHVVGDSMRGEFPVDFTVRLLGVGGVLRHERIVLGNTLVDWEVTITPVTEVTQCVLVVQRWSHVGRQAKILEFFSSVQETYEADDLMRIHLLEEREIATDSLPVGVITANEIEIEIDNPSGKFDAGNSQSPLYELLKQNRRIRAWVGVDVTGTVEWVPLGIFWSGEWHSTSNHLYAKTTGRDRLEMLRVSTYATGQLLTNQTLHSLAVAVLVDAGLTPSEYWVDSALQALTVPFVWFGTVSHREALRQIAEAALGQVYVDRNGIIRVEGVSHLLGQEAFVGPWGTSTQSVTITADNYFHKDTPVKWGELANRIEVETQPLSPVGVAEEVYRSNVPVPMQAGQTLTVTVFYNNPPVIDAVASLVNPPAGKTITGATYYAWGADVTVHSTTTSVFTLSISGRPLIVQNRNRISVQDADSIRDNGLLRYKYPDNHLVQTRLHAQFIADTLLRLYRYPRRDLTMDWRGNPAVTLGDVVLTRAHDRWLRYWMTKQTIEYDGALRSTIEGRLAR